MKLPDPDKIRSEKVHTLTEFMKLYNENLPSSFPKASAELLEQFRSKHADSFKSKGGWSLDQHRKKVMDWLCALHV
jgi:hypothetical protein